MNVDFSRLSEVLGRTLSEDVRRDAEHKRIEVANELGLDPSEISTALMGLAQNMADKGVIVGLSIGRTRFEQGLSPEDIGLATGLDAEMASEGFKEYMKTLQLGKRSQVTSEYQNSILAQLQRVDTEARNALNRNSIPIRMGFGREVIRFVPLNRYHNLRDELSIHAAGYESLIDELVSMLPAIRGSTESMLWSAAQGIYRMLQRNSSMTLNLDEFRERFVDAGIKAFPLEYEVRDSAYFHVKTMLVPFAPPAPSDESRVDMSILQEIKDSLVSEKNAFVQSIMGHLHQTVYDVVVSTSACIRKHGTLLGPNVKSLRLLFEEVNKINSVMGDRALAEQLAVLQTLVEDSGVRNLESIAVALNGLREQTTEVLTTLGQAPRLKRGGEMPDELDPNTVKAMQASSRAKRGKNTDSPVGPSVDISVHRKRRGNVPMEGQLQII